MNAKGEKIRRKFGTVAYKLYHSSHMGRNAWKKTYDEDKEKEKLDRLLEKLNK